MNEQRYDQQALNEYLLGSLPAADAELFDELSFTDADFSDALNAAEKDLVDGYARNELDTATLEKFKTHYLASPKRRGRAEFAKAFQVYAAKNGAETAAMSAIETEPERTSGGFFSNIFTVYRPVWQWSFALAALVLLFFGGWLWQENSRLRSEISQADANRERLLQRETELADREKQLEAEAANRNSADSETERELAAAREERAQLEAQLKKQAQEARQKSDERRAAAPPAPENFPPRVSIASFILAPSLRGGGKIQTVSIPSRAATVAAGLELETNDYAAYRAVLRSQADNRILWQSGSLKSKAVGENFRLSVRFPAVLLKADVYSIEVSGIAADGEAEIINDYSFRVVR